LEARNYNDVDDDDDDDVDDDVHSPCTTICRRCPSFLSFKTPIHTTSFLITPEFATQPVFFWKEAMKRICHSMHVGMIR
jgi:hypothetical protein